MFKRLITILLAATAHAASAQQLIGLTTNNYIAVNQLALNPAYVNNARFAPEISLFSVSMLAGNNAYTVSTPWILGGAKTDGKEGKEYIKLSNNQKKKAWVNMDIQGPAFSFTFKKQYQFGLYTRFRTIVNAGNLPIDAFNIYTSDSTNPQYYHHTLNFEKVGASAHAFGEVGISLGKMVYEDDMYKVSAGVNIKYLMGFAAANVYSKSLGYQRSGDSIMYANGDIAAMYTYNASPSGIDPSTRGGKGGLGLDIGAQYHYFPNTDPNKEIKYQLSIAASITDIGSVTYIADAGSAKYNLTAGKTYIHNYEFKEADQNELAYYLERQGTNKVIVNQDKLEKFRIGLPTAFRVNVDYNPSGNFFISFNTLLNLRGNSATVYRPSYISYLNMTPRIDIYKTIKLAMPITLLRYRDLAVGTIVYLGPLYVGSSTFITSVALGKQMKDIDVYAGMGIRLVKREYERYSSTKTYDNAYDDPNRGLKRLIPRFLRSKEERGILCPPSK